MGIVTISDVIALLAAAGQLVGTTAATDAVTAVPVTGLSCDSRVVTAGHVFVCKGTAFKTAYLDAALAAGAVAYVADVGRAADLAAAHPSAAGIVVRDVRVAMGLAAPLAWGNPNTGLRVTGVTGTKGKSTVTCMLRSILDVAAGRVGATALIGSIETYDGVSRAASVNTTPEAPDLWRHLANARDAGLSDVVMEVSSQALKYNRVDGLSFDVAAFTNLGRDHISPVEHPTLEDYVASKLRIFGQSRVAVVNAQTSDAPRVLAAARAGCERLVTFDASGDAAANVYATDVRPNSGRRAGAGVGGVGGAEHAVVAAVSRALPAVVGDGAVGGVAPVGVGGVAPAGIGTSFVAHTPAWTGVASIPLPGGFNVENALAAIAVACELGVGRDAICAGLAATTVPGRMEVVTGGDGIVGVVDFAHNAMAFERFFPAVRAAWPGAHIVAVFGATGDKGVERRHELPAVAARWANHLVFTEDDAGEEAVEDICAAMVAAVDGRVPCEVVPDREAATRRAVVVARSLGRPTVVCLLGRGTEPTMHRGRALVPFPLDADLLRTAFGCA